MWELELAHNGPELFSIYRVICRFKVDEQVVRLDVFVIAFLGNLPDTENLICR